MIGNKVNESLHAASKQGRAGDLRGLVQQGGDVDAPDEQGYTALHHASANGKTAVVTTLLFELGADPNTQDAGQWTPLHSAAYYGCQAVMKELLAAGADPSALDREKKTPLAVAASRNQTEAVRILNAWGPQASFDTSRSIKPKQMFAVASGPGWPSSSFASDSTGHNLSALREALRQKLSQAIISGSLDSVTALTSEHSFLLTWPESATKRVPLQEAAALGRVALLEDLANNRLLVNVASRGSGRTALHEAAHYGHLEAARWLLHAAAQVNAQDNGRNTPLILACMDGHTAMAELLIGAGADISLRRGDGKSALHILKANGASAVADKLETLASRRDIDAVVHAEFNRWKQEKPARFGYKFISRNAETGAAAAALDVIRNCKFDVLADSPFSSGESTNPHCNVYLGLAYTGCAECSLSDAEEALRKYESDADSNKSGLLLLAFARVALRGSDKNNVSIRGLALLREFEKTWSDAASWLTDAERALLKGGAKRKAENVSSSHYSASGGGANEDPIRREWNRIKAAEKLTQAQCKPMEELLDMVGLDAVKNVALNIFTDMIADKRLAALGHTGATGARALNFAFVGNPGTGKKKKEFQIHNF